MTLILKNATYIDWKSLEFIQTNIKVTEGVNGTIRFIDKIEDSTDGHQVIDCSGKYVTKSFAIGHHHVYSALARGMPAPKKTPNNFPEILKYIWWNLDKSLDEESIKASALATAIACAKAGSTFVIDHHASPNSETERYLQKNQGLIGLHASFTVGNETMEKATDLMQSFDSGIHIHVAEDVYDQKNCEENYQKRVVERLNDFGLLNSSKTILGHCLHLDENERKLVRKSKAWVVENMESNLKNNVGYFNGDGLEDRIMLGTDGMHSDMLRSAQAAFFVGQRHDNIDYASAYSRFRNVHRYLESNSFSGDGENSLVVLDYHSPTPMDKVNFLGHFIFGLTASDVQHVISNGMLIVKNKSILTVDEDEILDFTREQALKLWERMSR